MKNILDRVLTYFIILLAIISSILTRKLRGYYGKLLGIAIYIISKKRRNITYSNLRYAFPEKSEKEIKEISIKSFHNLGITFAELFALGSLSPEKIKDYITYISLDEIEEVYNRKKGVIFLSAHFGNWELMAFGISVYRNMPMTIIVKPQKNKFADIYLNSIRTKYGNKIVAMRKSAYEIVKCLRNKETIALLADQAAQKGKDLRVEFFGRPASTYEAPAQLALKFKVPIIMGFTIRQPDGRYICESFELDHSHLQDNEEGIAELTRLHVSKLEEFIRMYPDHWVWQHRRWKH